MRKRYERYCGRTSAKRIRGAGFGMTESAIVIVGILMSAGGMAAFLMTWQILLKHPERYLLGGVESIWRV